MAGSGDEGVNERLPSPARVGSAGGDCMMSDLYQTDALAWSEQQATLLQHVAKGERINEMVDWPNVIEEIEAMGRAQLDACESLIGQALLHLLKLCLRPDAMAAPHWRGETYGFLSTARRRFGPSMRRRIVLEELYQQAVTQTRLGTDDPQSLRSIPATCPYTLDDLLAAPSDLALLVARLDQATLP